MAAKLFKVRYRKVVNKPDWVAELTMELIASEGDTFVFLNDTGAKREKVRIHKRNLVGMVPA